MVRVLHIFGQMYKAGAESRIMDIYESISRKNIQFDFIVMKPGNHYFFEKIKNLGGNIFYIMPPSKVGYFNYAISLFKILKEKKYKIVHSHVAFNSGIIMFISFLAGVKLRITHSRSSNDLKEGISWTIYKVFSRVLIFLFSNMKLTCSVKSGKYLFGRLFFLFSNVRIFPNAINLKYFKEINNKSNYRTKLNINNDALILGNVANLRPVKNHLFLFKIFNEVIKINPNSYLLIAGEGPERIILNEFIINNNLSGKIIMLGQLDDVKSFLGEIDLFILTSIFEGVPGALIEALALNKKSIVSDSIELDLKFPKTSLKHISLKKSSLFWAEEIIKFDKEKCTISSFDILKSNYYDSFDLSKKYERLYLENK